MCSEYRHKGRKVIFNTKKGGVVMAFAIFRVEKLKAGSHGKGTLGQTLRHLEKHSESAEISRPEMSDFNYINGDTSYKNAMKYINKCKEVHKKNNPRAVRNDAPVALEMVFSYSPEQDNQNMDFFNQFKSSVFDFMKKEFPFPTVAYAYHFNESSFHIHIVSIPYDKQKKRLSAKDAIGSKANLIRLQNAFANCCKSLGLQRGISKRITKKNHLTKEEHNRQILLQKEQYQKECHQVAEDILR